MRKKRKTQTRAEQKKLESERRDHEERLEFEIIEARPRLRLRPRASLPPVAGVLALIAACACIFAAVSNFILYVQIYQSAKPISGTVSPALPAGHSQYLLIGFSGLLGFGFGTIAGIFALKREDFPLVAMCGALVTLVGILTAIRGWDEFLRFGAPTLALIGSSMILAAISRAEFT